MITYYVACSLDNFIAGPKGELDWLPQPDADDDFGYKAFYDSQELMVMGRKTYETCLSFGLAKWPYHDKETVVLTRQTDMRIRFKERFEAFDPAIWRSRGKFKRIYLNGGGEVAKLFLDHGLIDRLELAVIPITLGAGLPLFAPGSPPTQWALRRNRVHPSGVTLSGYDRE